MCVCVRVCVCVFVLGDHSVFIWIMWVCVCVFVLGDHVCVYLDHACACVFVLGASAMIGNRNVEQESVCRAERHAIRAGGCARTYVNA